MKCPKCSSLVIDHILEGKLYHKCGSCDGIWFDKGELAQIMQEKDWFRIDSKHKDAKANIEGSRFKCPRDGAPMNTVEYGHETGVKLQVCSDCGGIWLDAGEIRAIHSAHETWLDRIKELIDEELTAVELFLIKIGPYLPK